MSDRAMVTRREPEAQELASADADQLGVRVAAQTDSGTLVEADPDRLAALERQGYRVKLLRDTNLLRIGDHEIDIEAPATAADDSLGPDGAVPPELADTWPLHLVQLVAPPTEEWVRVIEARDIDVVEPISSYGLVVAGQPEQVAALAELPFVAWTGLLLPAYRIDPSARGLTGVVPLNVTVYPATATGGVEELLAAEGATIRRREVPALYGGTFAVLTVEVDAARIADLAAEPHVRWIEHRPPYEPLGEREAQILAENLDGVAAPNTAPVTGYQAWLAAFGLSGAGVTVAVADTGIDANAANNATGHTDLRGRQVAFVDYSAGAVVTDTDGHGTHVAGIAVGSAATGQAEGGAPANFLWGQGMAPQAGYVTQAFLLANPQPATATLIADAAVNAAQVMNNSWGINNSPGAGYTSGARTIDRGVRDPNPNAAGLEHLVIVCSAGNDGGSDRSISSPHESKNDIVVGNSLTRRTGSGFPGDDIRGISASSSRGLAVDGRILPTVVAPGTDVSSAFSRTSFRAPIAGTGTPDPANPAVLIDRYLSLSGTSMAAPAVSGTCALLTQWWRQTRNGANPSPALLKALLVNGAEDLAGGQNWRGLNRTTADKATWSAEPGTVSVFRRTLGHVPAAVLEANTALTQVGSVAAITAPGQWFFDAATSRLFVRTPGSTNPSAGGTLTVSSRDTQPLPNIPNGHQGWGRVSLENLLLQAPASDRGPRIVTDQRHAFTAAGQEHLIRVAPVDPGRPLRVTLAWTDAAGAAGSNPALVNDLDLEVTELNTGTVFKGNVFAGGFSVAGGTFDDRNNVECVYLQNPTGVYEVRVIAAAITAPARPDLVTPWQDFALVIDNAEVPPTNPVSVVPVLDRSGSMVAYGYVDATRAASRQFIGLLGIDDRLGVVSFGDSATLEFPPGAGGLATVTGQAVRDAAGVAIDAIGFGGCTFMGDGIERARDLLAGGVGNRGMVLLSDGYDNKGCDPANPAKPSAAAAAATLPAGVALHTCAMGPAADQVLLSGLATGGGRYYYMPAIDDLFEIYNYIRGQVSGDAVSVIASAQASRSSVAVMVDALATTATFTVAWADPGFRAVLGEPHEPEEVGIRLRDPRGELLHPDTSQMHRIVGDGFVAFRLHEPAAGQWQVELSTMNDRHLRYTVGGFCSSRLRLGVAIVPPRTPRGGPLTIGAVALLDGRPIGATRGAAAVVAPAASLDSVLTAHRDALAGLRPPTDLGPDSLPPDIARMATLRRDLGAAGKPDPFGTVTTDVRLRAVPPGRLGAHGLGGLVPNPAAMGRSSGVLAGRFDATREAGSYNVVVRVSGIEPSSGARFTRQELVSVLVT